MSEYWELIYQRGLQTIGVWQTFASTFTVGDINLTGHMADVHSLQGRANERDIQQDTVDIARSARDQNIGQMEDLCVRFPRLLEGILPPDDPLHAEISDIRSVIPNTPDRTAQRSRRSLSLWRRVNGLRAAATPLQPPLLVGSKTEADLQTILDNQGPLMQTIETERGKLTARRETLRLLAVKVDQANKRWFAAWEGFFPESSPERNALSQIDTGSALPPPTALEIASASASGPRQITVSYAPDGGDRATSLRLFWQRVGLDTDFANSTTAIPAGQQLTDGFVSGQIIHFKTRASNSSGSAESEVMAVLMP